ncbi:SpoIID/LytB domain-containing protein [Patescibacteria group bacterium]
MQSKSKHYVLGGLAAVFLGAAFLFIGNWGKMPLAASDTTPKAVKAGEVEIDSFKDFALDLKDEETKEVLQTSADEALELEQKNEDEYHKERDFTQLVTPEFEFTAVTPHWLANTPKDTSLKLFLRISDGKNWDDWQEVKEVDATRENSKQDNYKQGELVFGEKPGKFFEYKVELDSKDSDVTPTLEEVTFHYLNAEEGPDPLKPEKLFGVIPIASADTSQHYSRSAWGANEAYRFSNSKEEWPRKYASTKSFVVHHTAGTNNPSNPSATIRAIYYYHAVTLNWGDIGYNYIVDQHGNSYEGRYGGNNVVAGHAANYNYGTSGVSVLGNFETASPTTSTLDGIARLINSKTSSSFNPLGTTTLTKTTGYPHYSPVGSKTVYRISGHKNLNSTACPGANLYPKLATIRSKVKALQVPAYDYVLESIETLPAKMNPLQKTVATVKLKNTGSKPWYRDGDWRKQGLVYLDVARPNYHKAPFNVVRTKMKESKVNPGGIATYNLTINAPEAAGNFKEYFQAVVHRRAWLKDRGINLTTSVERDDLDVRVLSVSKPSYVTPGGKYDITIKAKNLGNKTWRYDGTTKVRLGTYDARDHHSAFYVSGGTGWQGRGRVRLQQSAVKPGQTGVFKIRFSVPSQMSPGAQVETFKLVQENVQWFGPRIKINTRVRYLDKYSFSSIQKPPSSMLAGQTAQVSLKVKNTGNTIWNRSGDRKVNKVVKLAPCRAKYRKSSFKFNRVSLQETTVNPGGIGTFNFTVKAPSKKKSYKEYFCPVIEGKKWLSDNGMNFKTRVEPRTYRYSFHSYQKPPSIMQPNQKKAVNIKIKNTGNVPWYKHGTHPMKIGISNPKNSKSAFNDTSWTSSGRRVNMDQDRVNPGQIASFTFTMTAPARSGSYKEAFTPVLSGYKWLPYQKINFYVKIPQQTGGNVKVGITHSRSSRNPSGNIRVSGSGTFILKDNTGAKIKTCSERSVVSVGIKSGVYYLYYNGKLIKKTRNYPVFAPVGNTILYAPSYTQPGYNVNGDRRFRGWLMVRYSSYGDQYFPAALWLINKLDIEDHLKGIAEQGETTPREAFKNFAVVSRTYAAYNQEHPKSICSKRNFQLFSNTYSQVYKGYQYELRAPNMSSAVDSTRGIKIIYGGKPIVAAYHSRCGGSTRTMSGYSYLKGVSCSPHRCVGPRKGHGWGMCMEGARNKASAGWDWKRIIRHYYTGVNIKDFY